MAIITDIKPQVKDKLRCNIYLDGRFYCGIKLETVMQHRLKVGVEIAETELSTLQMESEKAVALDKAMTYLSRAPKTKREVRRYLAQKGYLQDVVDYVMEKLAEYRFVDDEEYAKSYVRSAKNKKGARLIRAELMRKGADSEAVESAMEDLGDQSEIAAAVAQKYLRGKEKSRENAAKAYRYLLSRGYDYDTAKAAVDGVLGDHDETMDL